ncbi:MAG TPA: hypothetical protein VEW03_10630 [Longimicrobiaceae bacterium]|nr:hypothetical protein [Longimicrobiaceae bacterium]
MHSPFPLIRWAFIAGGVLGLLGGLAWIAQRGRDSGGDRRQPAAAAAAVGGAAGSDSDRLIEQVAGGVCRLAPAPIALPAQVHEASGVAVSRSTPGVVWVHNDSGEPQLLAVAADGASRGLVRVTGAAVEDWEDVASGPCAAGSCLYVADIGDNQARRQRITVYRVPEPAPGATTSAAAEALHATYPDGPQDAEALFVTQDGGVFVVTKGETGPIALYRFPQPLTPGAVARLERVVELGPADPRRAGRVTGAAASPDGRWVALRGLHSVAFYRAAELLAGRRSEPVRVDLTGAKEAQGEGVALAADGTLYLVSEGGRRRDPATLTRAECTLPPG